MGPWRLEDSGKRLFVAELEKSTEQLPIGMSPLVFRHELAEEAQNRREWAVCHYKVSPLGSGLVAPKLG